MLKRLLDSPWLYFGLAAVVLIASVLYSSVEVNLPTRPVGGVAELRELRDRDDLNVVFILVDTLRADHLSTYGYERKTSPTLDFLAESGLIFRQVEAQSSWTKSSMASLWTGAFPRKTGVLRYPDALSAEAQVPAEILKEAGFLTAGLYRNGWVESNFGFAQGFDMYLQPRPNVRPERLKRANPSAHPLQGTDLDVTESALEFINSAQHQRFFLYLHYMDVHQYLSDDETSIFGNQFIDSYDNAILWTDRNVSGVLGHLEALDLLKRTLVVLVSDHGESFLEHATEGHAKTLYAEVTNTPWLMLFPFRLAEPAAVETPVRNVDVWPTILDMLGLPALEHADGRSQLPEIEAAIGGQPIDAAPELSIAELDNHWGKTELEPRPLVAVVEGPWRYLRNAEGVEQLFDRRVDPTEQVNLIEEHPERLARYQEAADEYLATEQVWSVPQIELDSMRLGQLKALGYVVE